MNRSTVQKRVYDLASEANVLAEKWRGLLDDMREYFDDRSEKWQEGETGDKWMSLMDDIEAETDKLEEVGAFSRLILTPTHSPIFTRPSHPLTFRRVTTSLHALPVTSCTRSLNMRVTTQKTVFKPNAKAVLKSHRCRAIRSRSQTPPNLDKHWRK